MSTFIERYHREGWDSIPKPLRCWLAIACRDVDGRPHPPLQMDSHLLFVNEAPGPTVVDTGPPSKREQMRANYPWPYQF